MKNLEPLHHTALVTGAASGLGFEFSKLLANDKFDLILVDINKKGLQDAKTYLDDSFDVKTEILVQDLSKTECCEEVYKFTKHKTVDILINNAGFGLFGPFKRTNWKREEAMINLHVQTTTHMTKLYLQEMINNGYGRILNISSLAAFEPGPLMSIYYASKAYILSFSEAIANELKGSGITVTVLCPGPTKTNFQKVVSNSSSPNKIGYNMASARDVALIGYKAMLSGKTIAVPGFLNKIISFLPRIMPRKHVTATVRWIQEKNREKQIN